MRIKKSIIINFLLIILCNSVFAQFDIPNTAVDVTKYLPVDFVKDGTIDYLPYLQKGLDENRIVKMPDFPILVNESGLKIKSNSTIYFQSNSKLIMKPNNLNVFAILWIVDVENINLYSCNLVGDRYVHKGIKGEHGMGIHIMNASNITIQNSIIKNSWGDGIYIGGGNHPSTNIIINNARIEYSRRNGVSITNADRVTISNSVISHSDATPPMAGIDIEPNSPKNIINNILIDNVITKYNLNWGIVIALNEIYFLDEKEVNITIKDHLDYKSGTAFCQVANSEKFYNKTLGGRIKIINPIWIKNKEMIRIVGSNNIAPLTTIKNIKTGNDVSGNKRSLNALEKLSLNRSLFKRKNIKIE